MPSAGSITDSTIPGAIMPAWIAAGTYDVLVNSSGGTGTGTKLTTLSTGSPKTMKTLIVGGGGGGGGGAGYGEEGARAVLLLILLLLSEHRVIL